MIYSLENHILQERLIASYSPDLVLKNQIIETSMLLEDDDITSLNLFKNLNQDFNKNKPVVNSNCAVLQRKANGQCRVD